MYCNRGSLVVEETVLQYSLVGSRFVLQYKLYCEPGVGLCRDTTRARQLGTRLGAQAGAGVRSRRAGRAAGAGTTRGRAGLSGSGRAWQAQQAQVGRAG